MDLSKYEEIFQKESGRYLAELDDLFIRLKVRPGDHSLWAEAHGKVHSIKGMARALSMEALSALCHRMENWCKEFQTEAGEAGGEDMNILADASEILKLMVARRGELDSVDARSWYSRTTEMLDTGPGRASIDKKQRQQETIFRAVKVKPIDEVRVKYTLIEELMGLGQEIQMLEKSKPILPPDDAAMEVENWIDQAMVLMKNFFFRLSQLRLMPVEDFMGLFSHALQRLSMEANKRVKLEVVGGEIQADVTLLERLREPLLHLMRNCIAHGIESPDERRTVQKPEEGTICVTAVAFKERLHLKISDDGRGIDLEPIRTFLKEHRRLSPEAVGAMSQQEVLHTILDPGYSSVKEATGIAGRGVGMSVVAQEIENLGGSLSIHSEMGKGSTFEICMPLSLSIIYAVIFRIGQFSFSVPTSEVSSIQRVEQAPEDIIDRAVNVRHMLMPSEAPEGGFCHLIELKKGEMDQGQTAGAILADDIVGNRPLMVMPITEPLAKVGLYSGIGIMENGDVSMALDVHQLRLRQGPEDEESSQVEVESKDFCAGKFR